ncbi:MAG TPA: 30S ribosomal protein S9 [Candidatus Paceibacterota bacterium]|nr:30S ribosomal protein S9 [Candidatus Paceibacterota bacterium]
MVTKEKSDKFIETIGRRKTAIARARLTPGTRTLVTINNEEVNKYFDTEALRLIALEPFLKVSLPVQFTTTVVVKGGGIAGQAVAVRHAISRALVEYQADLRTTLKKEGFLKRDPRAKERRKFGLKKARKRAQWSKR